MANITSLQILEDGPRNVVVKVAGVLDTADISLATLLDPATLSDINPAFAGIKAATLAISTVQFTIEPGLAVQLFWDATTDDLALSLTGNDTFCFQETQLIQNPKSAGYNGKLLYKTSGWATVKSFVVVVLCIKQGTFG